LSKEIFDIEFCPYCGGRLKHVNHIGELHVCDELSRYCGKCRKRFGYCGKVHGTYGWDSIGVEDVSQYE
jgi:hypothetical protein